MERWRTLGLVTLGVVAVVASLFVSERLVPRAAAQAEPDLPGYGVGLVPAVGGHTIVLPQGAREAVTWAVMPHGTNADGTPMDMAALQWAATSTVPWLTLSTAGGQGVGTLTATVDTTALSPGVYAEGAVVITVAGAFTWAPQVLVRVLPAPAVEIPPAPAPPAVTLEVAPGAKVRVSTRSTDTAETVFVTANPGQPVLLKGTRCGGAPGTTVTCTVP